MAPKDPEEEGGEKKAEEQSSSGGKKKKLIIFGAIGIVVVMLAIGIPLLFMGKGEKADGESAEEEAVPEVIYKRAKLDTFIVNLSEAKRFLKVTMLIEYDPNLLVTDGGEGGGGGHGGGGSGGAPPPAPDALPPQIKEKEAQVRDAVIQVLSSKRAEDVLVATGKQSLKEELVEAINTALEFPEPPVVQVYFTEFIIQ